MSKKPVFLILSGPTKEYIDPVRYLSNESSGKMGNALARSAFSQASEVIFISGPVTMFPRDVKLIKVTTALEMFKELKSNFKKADIIVSVAAIADYRPVKIRKHKIKKTHSTTFMKFTMNPDIIKYCGENKKKQVIVGFALETKNLLSNAKFKLKNKNLDLIVANEKKSFGANSTTVYILSASNTTIEIKNKNKKVIAEKIISETIRIFKNIKTGKNIS
jgi:phosphopantothenoylcysteine synthetase/decarboxylase